MLFNSIEFLLFLPIVFALYWMLAQSKLVYQNLLLLLASYVFYGWWDYRFLGLIIMSTIVDYAVGLKIAGTDNPSRKKRWLWVSVVFNLGLLGFFKYFNFFVQSWVDAFERIGYQLDPWTLQIILPVGISFYTFQTMSYSIDIYRGQLKPTRDFIGFAAFVTFFPQLVAGPIERASNLLPQILQKRNFDFDQARMGVELILWGLFKKVVIADSMATIVNQVYDAPGEYNTLSLITGAVAFSFQIYGDFSGYSDMAIGIAMLFGIRLMMNFNRPYLSRNIGEFWRRWHISLSTWFRDYLYIPLGGSRGEILNSLRNICIIFIVSGFWHGANWTFIAWGGLHAIFFIPTFLIGYNRRYLGGTKSENMDLGFIKDMVKIVYTFTLVTFAWIFFRSPTVNEAIVLIRGIMSNAGQLSLEITNNEVLKLILSYIAFFSLSSLVFNQQHSRSVIGSFAIAIALLVLITLFGDFGKQTFIYFQF